MQHSYKCKKDIACSCWIESVCCHKDHSECCTCAEEILSSRTTRVQDKDNFQESNKVLSSRVFSSIPHSIVNNSSSLILENIDSVRIPCRGVPFSAPLVSESSRSNTDTRHRKDTESSSHKACPSSWLWNSDHPWYLWIEFVRDEFGLNVSRSKLTSSKTFLDWHPCVSHSRYSWRAHRWSKNNNNLPYSFNFLFFSRSKQERSYSKI